MSPNKFSFSRENRFHEVLLEEFLSTARKLYQAASLAKKSLNVKVIATEDIAAYNYSKITLWTDGIEDGLKSKQYYSLDNLTQEVWNRAFYVQVAFHGKQGANPFMVCLSCDKNANAKQMEFYGQHLDEKTYQAITRQFQPPP